MMAKPTARIDLTLHEIECVMDGLLTMVVRMREIERAQEGKPFVQDAYRAARDRYDAAWMRMFDLKQTLPEDEDT